MNRGMDRATGKALDGESWLAQAVADILLTPIGTRVMRRDYGSELPALLDQPLNPLTLIRIYAATATALRRWLPELRLTRTALNRLDDGGAELLLEGHRTDLPGPARAATLTLPLTTPN